MGPTDLAVHLLSFLAPAAGVGLLVALAAPLMIPGGANFRRWWVHAAANSAAGALALAAGLWWWGVDGKMVTYAALVVAIATCQWFLARAWRR